LSRSASRGISEGKRQFWDGGLIPAVAKRACARLIKQVYEVDPLVCFHCAGPMRIIRFIEQPAVIDLPVPRTADREDPLPSHLVAGHDP
jgi:hypothetical protein